MDILISMVAFVLLQEKEPILRNSSSEILKIHKYAHFLSQKLELWQFIPCKLVEGVWVVLEEPLQSDSKYKCINIKDEEDFNIKQWTADFVEYQEAKDRVLFEGFECLFFDNENKRITNREINVLWHNKIDGWITSDKFQTVEDLVKYNLELTDSAKRQLVI